LTYTESRWRQDVVSVTGAIGVGQLLPSTAAWLAQLMGEPDLSPYVRKDNIRMSAFLLRWLLDHGMDVDARAAVDSDGFGGHTALHATVVSQPSFWMNHHGKEATAPLAELLLERGANPNARASLRKQLHPGYGEDTMHEYRDVTPLSWGRRFHRQIFVNQAAMRLIAARGGHD